MKNNNVPKKILYLTARSDQGGGPKHLMDLSIELKKILPQTELYFASPLDPPYGGFFSSAGKAYIKIPARSFSILSFIKIIFLIRKYQIPNIHSHGRGAGIYSRLLKIFFPDINIIHTFHGIHLEPGLLGHIKKLIDKILIIFTDSFIFVSNDEKRMGLSENVALASISHVIHNGVPAFNLLPTPAPPPPFRFVTLARIHFQKGFDIGLEFFRKFKSRHPQVIWEWHIAGEGNNADTQTLMNKIQKYSLQSHVFLHGNQNPTNFFLEKHLYISFSRWEGLPLAPLEALIMGVPCFLSKVTGHGDILNEVPYISHYDINQYESFESGVLDIIEEYEKHFSKVRNDHTNLMNRFSLTNMVSRTKSLYL